MSESLSTYDSPKWILRYAQYDGVVRFVIARFGNAESWQSTKNKNGLLRLDFVKSRNDGIV